MQKIKIFHIITDKNIGGAGRWLLNYLTYHNRQEFDLSVVIPKGSQLQQPLQKLNVTLIQLDIKEKSLDIGAVKTLYRLFKDKRPQVIHTHASLSARIAGKMAKVPRIIHTKHCMDLPDSNKIKRIIKLWINRGLSDKIIAISKAVEEELLATGLTKSQVVLIYNGIKPLDRFQESKRNELRQNYALEKDYPVIGQVGRLEKIKGSDLFIRAAMDLLKIKKDVYFLIVGTGTLEQELKDQVKQAGLDDHIIFTGYTDKIEEVMNLLSINVMASRSEALSLSIIEGMSIGIPGVGTNAGGIREVIVQDQTGELVGIGDWKGLSRAIIKLLDDKETYASYSKNAIQLVEEKFTAEKMARQIEELYK